MVESAFGILANRYQVFLNPIALEPENIKHVVLAGCSFHNFLCINGDRGATGMFEQKNIDRRIVNPGTWRRDVRPTTTYLNISIAHSNNYNSSDLAKAVCNKYRDYFMSEAGSVHWQNRFV